MIAGYPFALRNFMEILAWICFPGQILTDWTTLSTLEFHMRCCDYYAGYVRESQDGSTNSVNEALSVINT